MCAQANTGIYSILIISSSWVDQVEYLQSIHSLLKGLYYFTSFSPFLIWIIFAPWNRTENLLGSLEPLNSTHTSATTPAASNYDQIIDLGQTKLSNEDAVNSNPPSPFIAFEQNLNKKQSQENTSTVPGKPLSPVIQPTC